MCYIFTAVPLLIYRKKINFIASYKLGENNKIVEDIKIIAV